MRRKVETQAVGKDPGHFGCRRKKGFLSVEHGRSAANRSPAAAVLLSQESQYSNIARRHLVFQDIFQVLCSSIGAAFRFETLRFGPTEYAWVRRFAHGLRV